MNTILIMTDQHRWDCLGCFGHPYVQTPNLDALAAEGVRFTSTYAATAPCGPSRASLFTGKYPDGHGVTKGIDDFDPPDQRLLTDHLRAAGVHTGLVGKLHLHPFHRDFGFDTFKRSDAFYTNYLPAEAEESAYLLDMEARHGKDWVDDKVKQFGNNEAAYANDQWRFIVGTNVVDEADHPTTWTVDETIRFLENPPDAPFFLNVSIYGPHQPYAPPEPWASLIDPDGIELPASFHTSIEDKPIMANCSFFTEGRSRRKEQGWDEATHRRALAAYYGNISMIDHHLGRLFETLRERGLWDDTMIVFTSDHGDFAGQFGNYFKSLGYEGSAHVPMIIRHPSSPRNGSCETRPVNLVDLNATLLDFHNANATAGEGHSFLPLLMDENAAWQPCTFFKQLTNACVVQDHWKLMRDTVRGQTVYELYDLRESPREAVNLFLNPPADAPLGELRTALDTWFSEQSNRRNPVAACR